MTPERIFNSLAAFLRTRVEARGGVFAESETVAHTLSMLSGSPGRWRVIQQWQREDDTDNRTETTMRLLVIVQQGGQNLGVKPGDAITVQRPSALAATTVDSDLPTVDSETASLDNAPLMVQVTRVCQWLRAVRWTNKDIIAEPLKRRSAYWLNDPDFPTRQIATEWEIKFTSERISTVELTA